MNIYTEAGTLEFHPPGPGAWSIDAAHFPRPVSRFQAEIHPKGIADGFLECARRYGLLIDGLDFRFVNGFAYSSVIPAPEDEIPARFEAAERVFRDKIWRRDLERWDTEVKPASIKTHRALLAIDPDALSDEELAAYVETCRDNLVKMIRQHHCFNLAAILPVGDFMAHVAAWSSLPLSDYLALSRGAAPESAGEFDEIDDLAKALRDDPEARATLASDAPGAEIIARLRAAKGPVAQALEAYLDFVGYRLLNSLDTGEASAIEVPDALIARIRQALAPEVAHLGVVPEAELARLRKAIPQENRAMFDDLLEEVRTMSRLRDERGFYSDVWAGGVMRRALLAAGARLASAGRIEEPAHLIEASYDEIKDLLGKTGGPSGAELADRAHYRRSHRAEGAPAAIGDPPAPPPPMDALPPDTLRVMTGLGTAVQSLGSPPDTEREPSVVRGIGASPGIYTGPARVIDTPEDLSRLVPGDVLIAAATSDSFNIVLPLVGAIVTNAGGLLSHAAIVGREFGIPSVVGTRNATALITDGMQVTVNGATGEVEYEDG
ncbi:hypothetical protein ILP92_17460 [Maribius pontilimi]|uniref:PEP-utilising enzyme mobile domain-containing protein n=1 Tax=Palleronia pontilimi TaxID=1964209 RepID=A0A934IF77_9RHOB|nr:PEP-utilizing enzyme [Palleronia pontilimi]MBJ3764526.1 hypothetical protein [Palleronia pontilimi]